jgi:DNA (cytosine-5)-methyltransferase 1
MATIATLLSGGEGVSVGARAAGLTHLWGIEYDNDIANVARLNGFNVITADVMAVDPHTLEIPDVLHASPVCKRASNANQSAELNENGTKEAPEDIAAGEKIAQFIDVMQPRVFTLENVFQYRNFKAFKIICAALSQGGYMWDFDNLNAADYSVPQTRRRLILRAVRGSLLPMLPQPEPWTSWYSAIEDLIPTLPESHFAAWQLARLPRESQSCLIGGGNTQLGQIDSMARPDTSPAPTVFTDLKNNGRAFILDCQKAGDTEGERGVTLRQGDAPMFTVTGGKNGKQPVRAFIIANGKYDNSLVTADEAEPTFTVTANSNQTGVRAWLVSDQSANSGKGVQVRNETEPYFSIRAGENGGYPPRAWLSQGRVVSMTVRALARFQSFPDSYLLPENKKLACQVIGNAVPPLLYQKIIEPLAEATR